MSSSAMSDVRRRHRALRIAADSIIQSALQGSSLTYRLDYEMQSNRVGETRVTFHSEDRQTLATAVGLLMTSDELHEKFVDCVGCVDGRFDVVLRARPGLAY